MYSTLLSQIGMTCYYWMMFSIETVPATYKLTVSLVYTYTGPDPDCGVTYKQVMDDGPGNTTAAQLTTAVNAFPGPNLKGYVSYIGVEQETGDKDINEV